MMRYLLLTLYSGAACGLSLHAEVAKATGGQPPIAVEQISDELARCDDIALKKLAVLLEILRRESAAQRIPNSVAKPLIAALESVKSPILGREDLIADVRKRADNQLIKGALDNFESAVEAAQIRRSTLINQAIPEINRHTVESALHSANAIEIDRLVSIAESVLDLLRSRAVPGTDRWQISSFWCVPRFLRNLKALLNLKNGDDRIVITRTLSNFNLSAQLVPDLLSASEIEAIRRPAEVLRREAEQNERKAADKAVDQAENSVHSAFTEERSDQEISNAINSLELAWQQRRLKFGPLDYSDDGAVYQMIRIFREIADMARDRRAQNPDRMINYVISLGALRAHISASEKSAWDRLLLKWRDEWLDALKKAEDDYRSRCFTALKTLNTPQDLKKLLADAVAAERGGAIKGPAGLVASLSSLDADWETTREMVSKRPVGALALVTLPTPMPHSLFPRPEFLTSDVELGMAIHQVRESLARDLISESSNLAELRLPPLNEEPLGTALNILASRHASSGDWRGFSHITQILKTWFPDQRIQRKEAGQAAANYLAGVNCETFGEWSLAARSYKAVLRSAASPAPVKESAERLKQIMQKHPELKEPLGAAASTNLAHGL